MRSKYGWSGNYPSWKEAEAASSGYNSTAIVDRVSEALMKVKKGEAAFERDSVLFDRPDYSWPLLTHFLAAAVRNNGKLTVLDFGGSLGSTWFQNKRYLASIPSIQWIVVEQGIFVERGRQLFADNILRFEYDFEETLKKDQPDVVLFSSVLQYLESPFAILEKTKSYRPPMIIVDNTAFLDGPARLTVQSVPPEIYEASYPCWLFNRQQFLTSFADTYTLLTGFSSGLEIRVDGRPVPYEGFVFQRKSNGD
jgi:putative methyltransferase (TIGR04325 family)